MGPPVCVATSWRERRYLFQGGNGFLVSGNDTMARVRKDSKFEVYGQEMIEKVVHKSGNSGRIYLPPNWIGKRVKIIRVE